jgi:hypothetical protein
MFNAFKSFVTQSHTTLLLENISLCFIIEQVFEQVTLGYTCQANTIAVFLFFYSIPDFILSSLNILILLMFIYFFGYCIIICISNAKVM